MAERRDRATVRRTPPVPRGLPAAGLFLWLLAGCEAPGAQPPYAEVAHEDLSESSGLATSPARPGIWFTHNDSGGEAELFAFTLDGEVSDIHPVPGAKARDWEDMAAGPCPGARTPCLYIGDIGDNGRERKNIRVYATLVPEAGAPARVVAEWKLDYPDKKRNAETLLVDPIGGSVYIVTKDDDGEAEVYRLPEQTGKGDLIHVADLALPGSNKSERRTTAGDWHPDGDRVVVRTYTTAWEWQVDPADREAHWKRPPRRIPLPQETQGEAIAYAPDGRLVTTSEGSPMPLRFTDPGR